MGAAFGISPVGEDALGDLGPTDFLVRPGLEGPQTILVWTPPIHPAEHIVIRRKTKEYPRDENDGVLVLDDTLTLNSRTSVVDLGADLLEPGASPGDSRWWYYRIFVKPTPPDIKNQFAGKGSQEGVPAGPDGSEPIDIQEFDNVRVRVLNGTALGQGFTIQTAPRDDEAALWEDVTPIQNVAAGGEFTFDLDNLSYKHIRLGVIGGFVEDITVYFIVNKVEPFLTSVRDLSRPVLVYKTGRHLDLWWEDGQLPGLYRLTDEDEPQFLMTETTSADDDGEHFMLARDHDPRGPLYRFLYLLSLELDRDHAYKKAILEFNTDFDEAPPDVLKHIAFEMGWPLEHPRSLINQREQLLRTPGFWKARGSARLMVLTSEQTLGIVPRLLEGGGRVFRSADPSLFD